MSRISAANASPIGRCDLKGNNDLLVLSKPEVIREESTTPISPPARTLSRPDTFNSTTIAMADYQEMESLSAEINFAAAKLARAGADAWTARYAGKTALCGGSARARRPHRFYFCGRRRIRHFGISRSISWWPPIGESTKALVEGGSDLILTETVFDTLNAKAAIFAVKEEFEALGVENCPIMIFSGRCLHKLPRQRQKSLYPSKHKGYSDFFFS